MTETQRRIKAYRKALPHMKERVAAVGMLLVMAISMMTASTFAWMTLSRNPEVSSIATTITTNGNLEIALSGTEGNQPADTTVSDGGRDVTLTNLTWGNLINLSSESYGLSSITLRPASLNTNKLNTSPVYATEYGADGRVEGYITDFVYTNYDASAKSFVAPTKGMKYGVRAVSTVTYDGEDPYANVFYKTQLSSIYRLYGQACEDYAALYSNDDYMQVVYKLVQEYANRTLGNGEQDIKDDMDELMEMMDDLVAIVDVLGNAYVEMVNLEQYRNVGADAYVPYTLQDLIDGNIKNYQSNLTYYSSYITLRNSTKTAYDGIAAKAALAEQNKSVYFSDIESYVNILCNTSTATVNGYTVAYIKANVTSMAGEIIGWNYVPAVIHDGVLKDLDQFLDGNFFVDYDENRTITVKVVVEKTLHPSVTTSATNDSYALADYYATEEAASKGGGVDRGIATAAETYAMAIDIWVRTNEDNALLILEGDLVTELRTVTGEDAEGNTVDLYVYTYSETVDDITVERELTVYKNANGEWLDVNTHKPAADTLSSFAATASNPSLKTEEVVIGYAGVNRVWDELDDPNNAAVMIPGGESTTQGSGSCYIFYPESPEDQEQSLKLLAAMRVAFVSESGDLLTTAYMDTANAIEESGRVIVPLKLNANTSISVGDNGETEEYYITPLVKNQATRITALIYLEGKGLKNSDVLAAGSITGQMNIQFGTNVSELEPMENMELMQDYYNIDTLSDKTITFEENAEWTTDVKMLIEGMEPKVVKGNFISVINATQGARYGEFYMEKGDDGWYAYTYYFDEDGDLSYKEKGVTFDMPGNYQLRSLQIDGVDYALDEDDIVHVTVPGIGIGSLSWNVDGVTKTVLTADTQIQEELTLTLGSSEAQAHTVKGVFLGDNGKNVTVNFTQSNGHYKGTATFNYSGTYTMTYLYIDGAIAALTESQYKVMDLSLGLKTEIKISAPRFANGVDQEAQDRILKELTFTPGEGYSFVYTGEETLYFDFVCVVMDDSDNPIDCAAAGYAEGAVLHYGQGSTVAALKDELTWNGSAYEGTFEFSKFGIFNFNNLQLGASNFITKATLAHSITSIPADPMEYVGNNMDGKLSFDLGGEPTIEIYLNNAEAANLQVTLRHEESEQYYTATITASGEKTADGADIFVIKPKAQEYELEDGTRVTSSDGTWTIEDMKVSQVFYKEDGAESGTYYSGGDDDESWLDLMTVIPEGEVLSDRYITYVRPVLIVDGATEENVFDLGEDDFGSTFALGDSMTMKVVFKAFDGQNIAYYADIAGVTLEASADGEYVRSYGTNGIDTNDSIAAVEISGNWSDNELVLTVGEFNVAGVWTLLDNLTVKLDDNDYTLAGLPSVKATWEKPTVTITNISNKDTQISVDNTTETSIKDTVTSVYVDTKWYGKRYNWTWHTHSAHTKATPMISADGLTANVYFKCFHADDDTYSGGTKTTSASDERYHYYAVDLGEVGVPQVTITLGNLPVSFTSAILNFSNNNSGIYSSYGTETYRDGLNYGKSTDGAGTAYSWSQNNSTCIRYVGAYTGYYYQWTGVDNPNQAGEKTPAGTITANSLVVVYNGVTYTIEIPTITINNPY